MPDANHCFLTVHDFMTLELLLQSNVHDGDCFRRLLRQKLSTATVVFQDDIDARVSTIDSRVDFSVDGRLHQDCLLANERTGLCRGTTLAITTLRGLALLGLMTGDAVVIEQADGTREEIRLDKVKFQPEADRRTRPQHQPFKDPEGEPEKQSNVVSLTTRHKKPAKQRNGFPLAPEDHDPGPSAA